MANQVAAILSGEDYQHLYAWQFVLELLMPPRKVRSVRVEDPEAGSVDDVTVQHEEGTSLPDKFYQVKYHVDHREQYSTEMLMRHKPNQSSLLQKFWRTWTLLQAQSSQREIELYLVSNWTWDGKDKLKSCFGGTDNRLTPDFFDATTRSDIGKLRIKWQAHLNAEKEEFEEFVACLRFNLGFDCWGEMKKRVAERMENLKLKSDDTAMLVAAGIVREWIKSGQQTVTRDILEATLKQHNLYLPPDAEQCATLYLSTIREQRFDVEPDYVLDWRDYFTGSPSKRGHQLENTADWNDTLLPQLEELAERINRETNCRLIRARGLARLSAWFALGYSFPEVARYSIEVEQQGQFWRTDAKPNENFKLTITSKDAALNGETLDGTGKTVAVGISVTGLIDDDVRRHLETRTEKVAALLLIRPKRELGRNCLQGAADAVALADGAKKLIRAFIKNRSATRLDLYYFGPLSGACFLGHRLNAVCQEIQIMEDQQPGYAPSFMLR
ncbi:MAG: SAVED domain-containing protein [Acidobacteriota bacterium]|nr:SAVED domain-containing protein [Acidobacteriota bacterium]